VLACDFFTAETVFLKTLYVLFSIERSTKLVHIAGSTARPDSAWVTQQARNLAIAEDLEDKRILVRDRDAKYSGVFDDVLLNRTRFFGHVLDLVDHAAAPTAAAR
jgi:hypothetical protein